MKCKVRITVIDKKHYPELQEKYYDSCESCACPNYHVGDVFLVEEIRTENSVEIVNTLVHSNVNPERVKNGRNIPHCGDVWSAIAGNVYRMLAGVPIEHGCRETQTSFIACCSDGTRPVIFKIERTECSDELHQ